MDINAKIKFILGQKNYKIILLAALIFVTTFLTYRNSLKNSFLIDDIPVIVESDLIKSFEPILKFFFQPFAGEYYRPLASLSLAFDFFFWQLNPFGYHLSNIIIHALNAILFFLFFFLVFDRIEIAALSSILFAIHPINSTTVNYISDRGNLVAGFFMLAGLISFVLAVKHDRSRIFVLGFISFLLSLLSRENAVLFPAYLASTFFVIYKPAKRRRLFSILILASTISLLYLVLRPKLTSHVIFHNFLFPISFTKIKAFLYMLFQYISITLFPQNISFFQQISIRVLNDTCFTLRLLTFFSLSTVLIVILRKNKLYVFAIFWFLIGAIPLYKMIFSRPILGIIMQESWIYFSSYGLFLLISLFWVYLKRFINIKIWYLLLIIFLLAYIQITYQHNWRWKDAKTYCTYWLNIFPENPVATSNLASYCDSEGEFEKAIYFYKKTIQCATVYNKGEKIVHPLVSSYYNNIGAIYFDLGKLNEAIKWYKQALKINSEDSVVYTNIGHVYLKLYKLKEASFYYNEALKRNPQDNAAKEKLDLIHEILIKKF